MKDVRDCSCCGTPKIRRQVRYGDGSTQWVVICPVCDVVLTSWSNDADD